MLYTFNGRVKPQGKAGLRYKCPPTSNYTKRYVFFLYRDILQNIFVINYFHAVIQKMYHKNIRNFVI